MRIENRSNIDVSRVKPVLDFLVRRTRFSFMAVLYVLDSLKPYAAGRADKHNPDREAFPGGACPSLIRLWLPGEDAARYPLKTSVVDDVPPFEVRSWEEEVLVTLAHELQHLDDLWRGRFTADQAYDAEVEAERRAEQLLQEWRGA